LPSRFRGGRAGQAAADEVLDDRIGVVGGRPGDADLARADPGDGPDRVAVALVGAAFVQALSRFALIDEYRLAVLPVALGDGLPPFKDLATPLRLELVEAESFPGGTVIHVYRPQ
jgi:dihydrofolate reductase